jgi:hypothetical protein
LPVFTKEDTVRAQQVIELHKAMGHPSDATLGKMLESGVIKDCHLAPRDIRVARELFGKCNDCLRGKMKAPNVPTTSASPPADHMGTHWSADIFFVKKAGGCKRPLLLLTEEKTGLDVLYVLNSRSTREVHKAGKKFQHFIKQMRLPSDHKIHIVTDHEEVYKQLEISMKWAEVSQSAPDQHAKRAERKVDTIKRKMSAAIFGLPYHLPPSLYTELAKDVVMKNNFTPNANTGNQSPIKLALGKQLSMSQLKHLIFGTMVIAKTPNSQVKESIGAKAEFGIIVGFEQSRPENIRVFLPTNGHVVVRQKVEPIQDITDLVKCINKIAKDQQTPLSKFPSASTTSDSDSVSSSSSAERSSLSSLHPVNSATLTNTSASIVTAYKTQFREVDDTNFEGFYI